MTIDVFLSYSWHDREIAKTIYEKLTADGLSVWWDLDLVPGASWRDEILSRADKAKIVVVLWSERSVSSEWVRAEAQYAFTRDKLFPVRLEPVRLPLGFLEIQYFDLSTVLDDTLQALSNQIQARLTRSELALPADAPGERAPAEAGRQFGKPPNAKKTKIFIAHASADKPKIKPIIEVLIDCGFGLWIDRPQKIGLSEHYERQIISDRVYFGSDWKEGIREAISRCDKVLAHWSSDAVLGRREQFHYEAYQGMMASKLVQCRIDDVDYVDIGMPYTFDHIADLSDFSSGSYHAELDILMQDMTIKSKKWWHLF